MLKELFILTICDFKLNLSKDFFNLIANSGYLPLGVKKEIKTVSFKNIWIVIIFENNK